MLCSVNVQVLIDVVNVHSTLCHLVKVVFLLRMNSVI